MLHPVQDKIPFQQAQQEAFHQRPQSLKGCTVSIKPPVSRTTGTVP